MKNITRYLKIAEWLRKRYEFKPGMIITDKKGKPTRFTLLERAFFDRYLLAD